MNSIRTRVRRFGLAGALWAIAASAVGGVPPASAAPSSVTFNTPGNFTWSVPVGVHQVVLDLSGAQGGTAHLGMPGGLGGHTQASLSVTPGETLQIAVGGAGVNEAPPETCDDDGSCHGHGAAGGFNGGGSGGFAFRPRPFGNTPVGSAFPGAGGGGASDVRRAPYGLGNRLVVAAGGGGGSLACIGGVGGGDVGGGSSNCSQWSGGGALPNQGGFGGTADFYLTGNPGDSGDVGHGGAGGSGLPTAGEAVGGGGGGGGWFGGGGGGGGTHTPNTGTNSIGGGAGGGGNSFIHPSGTNRVMTSGVRSGDGVVSITYFVPSITASAAPAANAFGWNNTDVGVAFSASNPGGSPIDSITYSTTGAQSAPNTTVPGGSIVIGISAEGTTTARGIARDDGGSESAPASLTVNIDKTPPTIFGGRSVQSNANGWNNTDVTVSWTCSDALSGIQSCSSPTVMDREGGGQTALGIASDRAGNSLLGFVSPISIDKTPPTISGARDLAPNSRGWNNTDVAVLWTCSDALSGVQSCPTPITVFAEGAGQSFSGSATDRAGNSASATIGNINIDKTPPRLSDCRATDITDTRAIIRWTTSEQTDAQVEYGLTAQRGTLTPLDATLGTTHAVTLSSLQPGTLYHAQPRSVDIADNAATCSDFTFTTSAQNFSLKLDGTTGAAEAPHAADLNLTGDWAVETWFKDEDPRGFNHDPRQMLVKGDRNASSEAPYYVLIGNNHLLAGVRTGGRDYPIDADLAYLRLNPKTWHHVAVTFRADLNVLNLWLDGVHISYLQVPAHSSVGNTLPLQLGRAGSAGKYWLGKLDDVRIWSVARRGADITNSYLSQLTGAPSGLVANWHFDDGGGLLAVDSTGNHHDAFLIGGASFSADVHP